MTKHFFLGLLSIAATGLNAQVLPKPTSLRPTERQKIITQLVAEVVTSANYKTLTLNDSLSSLIFDRYIKALDRGHNYLLQGDIDSFKTYRTAFDEDLKTGDLNHAFQIFDRYQQRFREAVQYSISKLKQPYHFTQKETVVLDRGLLPYFENKASFETQWQKRVKYDLLVLSKTTSEEKKNIQTLEKRYQNLLSQDAQLTNQDVFQTFMNAVTAAVDPHAAYFNPFNAAEFDMSMSRSLEGIGATLALENGFIVIKSLVNGGPASKTKLIQPEDRIIGIAEGNTGEFTDVTGWRIDRAVSLIRGKKGTLVRLKTLSKLQSETDLPNVVPVTRDKIILEDQSAKKEIREYDSNGKKTKIGIISLPQFYIDYKAYSLGDPNYKSTTRDVALLIDSLQAQHVDGIVMDLRQNGGGSLTEAIDLTGLFIKTGPVVQVRDAKNRIQVDRDENVSVKYSGPLAVLVDRFSTSASEIFAAAIQDYGRGIIIGNQTYGKGTVQREFNLDELIKTSAFKQKAADLEKSEGTASGNQSLFGKLNITIGKFYRINGSSTQHMGVTPDVVFPTMYPVNQYGEDSEPSALNWDTIGKTDYQKLGNPEEVISMLNRLHTSRFKQAGLDIYLNENLKDLVKADTPMKISLNAIENKNESDQKSLLLLNRNNRMRKTLGLNPLKKGETAGKAEDIDFIKKEAGQVLTDFIFSGTSGPIIQGS